MDREPFDSWLSERELREPPSHHVMGARAPRSSSFASSLARAYNSPSLSLYARLYNHHHSHSPIETHHSVSL